MCDPFNTNIEAALWDERHDLDPFIAEHYATNAQHELDRLAASQRSSARLAYVRRLHARYSALAATAQLPEDSDFEESGTAESLEAERMAFVHPDRLDLISSGHVDAETSSPQTQARSPSDVSANIGNSVVSRNARGRRHARESSVEAIVRQDGFDSRVHGHVNPVNRNQDLQQWASPPFFHAPQPVMVFHEAISAMAGIHNATFTYHYSPAVTINNYYYSCESWHQSTPAPASSMHFSGGSRQRTRRVRGRGRGRDGI